MGWSSEGMRLRYQHLTDPVLRNVAARLDRLLWDSADGEPKPPENVGQGPK